MSNYSQLDYFPLWKPQRITEIKFNNFDFKIRFSALRNSSSAFIKRKDVRKYIFERDDYRCVYCGSKNDLSIDHIISVYKTALTNYPIEKLNIRENLQTLCTKCNSKKNP